MTRRVHTVTDPLFGPRYATAHDRAIMRLCRATRGLRRLARRYAAAVIAPESAADRFEGEAI